MFSVVLLGGLLLLKLVRQGLQPYTPLAGVTLLEIRVGPRERLLSRLPWLALLGGLCVVEYWLNWSPWPVTLMAALVTIAWLLRPARYRITQPGVVCEGGFYPWSEFDGYWMAGARLRLHGFSQVDLWLSETQRLALHPYLPHRLHDYTPLLNRLGRLALFIPGRWPRS